MPPSSEKSIFLDALEIEDARDRAARLEAACGGNPQLRADVEALLRAHDLPGHPLDDVPAGIGAARASFDEATGTSRILGMRISAGDPQIAEQPGTTIGPYKLMEQIGEGGFGLVFVAEQQQPVRRKVALKVVKPGMDTREVIARFEAERQALAMMDHPNIARMLDAGATTTGRPYFVMELVRGVLVTEFCDQNRLTLRERLELFVHICQAVQHAHQKGVIHRDLKPSNILVTLHDGTPVVKVIDFGVAKAIGQHLTDKTIYTRFAQMIGTPLYMSPEQAEMSGLDIDTRSDIYSLGVLLYELLSGATPFARDRMQTASFDELRRMIRLEEPPSPSARLTTLGQALPTISAQRKTEPRQLSALLRGDLDWIVMKALDKDRTRRYETAAAFADDVRRFLRQEPIDARPPSPLYRFRKFSRRNKAVLTTAALVMAALVLGTAVSTWQAVRATSARADADASRKKAEDFADRLKSANTLLDSARAHADEGRWGHAYADYTLASELQPDHYLVWSGRGSLYLRLGLWKPAALDYAKALSLGVPANNPAWWGIPQLFWYTGDERSYRESCAQIVRQLEKASDGFSISMALRSCLVAPIEVADTADLLRRAESLLPKAPEWPNEPWGSFGPGPGPRPPDRGPDRGGRGLGDGGRGPGDPGRGPPRRDGGRDGGRGPGPGQGPNMNVMWGPPATAFYIVALAQYRAGDFEAAIQRARESLASDPGPHRAVVYPDLAMAQHRAGQADAARETLRLAEKALDQWANSMEQGPIGTMPLAWFEWIEYLGLYREATRLITGVDWPGDPQLHTLEQRSLSAILPPQP